MYRKVDERCYSNVERFLSGECSVEMSYVPVSAERVNPGVDRVVRCNA